MALDNSTGTVANDNLQVHLAPAAPDNTLALLQKDAGVLSAPGDRGAGSSASQKGDGSAVVPGDQSAGSSGRIGDGLNKSFDGAIHKILDLKDSPPSDKDRADAEKTLEGKMSKLIPEADRQAMSAMTTAILNGDSKAFGEALKKAGGDPAKLKALVDEVDKMFEAQGASTRLDVTADGKVLVSDTGKSTALSFDPATGKVEPKSVEHNWDGSILVNPGELLHVDTDKTFHQIGDDATNGVNGKINWESIKERPFGHSHPFGPSEPWAEPMPFEPFQPHGHRPIQIEPLLEKPFERGTVWDKTDPLFQKDNPRFLMFDAQPTGR